MLSPYLDNIVAEEHEGCLHSFFLLPGVSLPPPDEDDWYKELTRRAEEEAAAMGPYRPPSPEEDDTQTAMEDTTDRKSVV